MIATGFLVEVFNCRNKEEDLIIGNAAGFDQHYSYRKARVFWLGSRNLGDL